MIAKLIILVECLNIVGEPTGAGLSTPTCAGGLVSPATQCY